MKSISWAWTHPAFENLGTTERFVAIRLAHLIENDEGTGRNVDELAEECGLSRRGFQRAISVLESAEIIVRAESTRMGGRSTKTGLGVLQVYRYGRLLTSLESGG